MSDDQRGTLLTNKIGGAASRGVIGFVNGPPPAEGSTATGQGDNHETCCNDDYECNCCADTTEEDEPNSKPKEKEGKKPAPVEISVADVRDISGKQLFVISAVVVDGKLVISHHWTQVSTACPGDC